MAANDAKLRCFVGSYVGCSVVTTPGNFTVTWKWNAQTLIDLWRCGRSGPCFEVPGIQYQ